jgi:chitodextrinase
MSSPSVALTCDPVAGLITGDGYQVYRDGTMIAGGGTTPLPTGSYVDKDPSLAWGTTHQYQFGAGQPGRYGPLSSPLSVVLTQPADTTPPAAPGRPTALSVTTTSVALQWPDNTEPDLNYYIVERATGTTTASTYTVVGAQVTDNSFTDSTVSAGTSYWYRVKAVDSSGNISLASQSVGPLAAAVTPATPTGLAVTTPSPHQAKVDWTAVSGANGYSVYRDGALVASGVQTNTFTETIDPGDYVYQVAAGLAPNLSPLSTPVAVQVYGILFVPSSITIPAGKFGTTQPVQYQISVTGRGRFTVADDQPWLDAQPAAGTLSDVPTLVTLSADPR